MQEIKIHFALVLVFVFTLQSYSQQITWHRTFNMHQDYLESGRYIIQTPDSGYALISSYPGEGTFLIKLDIFGNTEWMKTIDSTGSDFCIQVTSDSGFIIAGRSNLPARLIRTNSDGNVIWKRYYTINNEACTFYKAIILDNGNIVACGDIFYPSQAFVVKTDQDGNVIWQNTYHDSIPASFTIPNDINVLAENYFLTGINFTTYKTLFCKISSDGELMLLKSIIDSSYGVSILSLTGDQLAVGGTVRHNTMPSGYLAIYDASGNQKSIKEYQLMYELTSMTKYEDGYALCGESATGDRIRFITTDLNGNVIFNRSIYFSNELFYFARHIEYTKDRGYIITGTVGDENNSDIIVIKTDSAGTSPVGILNSTSFVNVFCLHQNFPNPFNPVTKIKFVIPANVNLESSIVNLTVYDALGKEIATLVNEKLSPGSYEIEFDGSNLPSGVYFYKLVVSGANSLRAAKFSETKRMILLK